MHTTIHPVYMYAGLDAKFLSLLHMCIINVQIILNIHLCSHHEQLHLYSCSASMFTFEQPKHSGVDISDVVKGNYVY